MWHIDVLAFVLVEGLQVAGLLVNRFGLVIGQHPVEVEGDPQFMVICVVDMIRVHDLARRIPLGNRLVHVLGIGRQKQVDRKRRNELVRVAALQKRGAGDVQPVVLDGVHDPHAGIRIIARQQHDFDRWILGPDVV